MSLAVQADAAVRVTLAVVKAVSRVTIFVFISMAVQLQPFAAVGSPITPLVADPPVPTFTSNAAVPFCCTMLGEVPKPEEMVGAVAEKQQLPREL